MENNKPAITCIVLTDTECFLALEHLDLAVDVLYDLKDPPHERIAVLQNVVTKLKSARFTRNY